MTLQPETTPPPHRSVFTSTKTAYLGPGNVLDCAVEDRLQGCSLSPVRVEIIRRQLRRRGIACRRPLESHVGRPQHRAQVVRPEGGCDGRGEAGQLPRGLREDAAAVFEAREQVAPRRRRQGLLEGAADPWNSALDPTVRHRVART